MEYYVYAYLDPTLTYQNESLPGIKNLPIYIGRGKNNRWMYHWKRVLSGKSLLNPLFNSKLKNMKENSLEPIIIKIEENLDLHTANYKEKYLISILGRKICDHGGILLNITSGGDGGITWIGENPFRGKTLEENFGPEKARKMKEAVSEYASSRVGILNSMFGVRGDLHPLYAENSPLYGKKVSEETKNKISNTLKEWWINMTEDEILELNNKIKRSKENWSDEFKVEIGKKISEKNKGRIFGKEHKEKLSVNNHKKNNKGSDILKLGEETRKKISNVLRGRKFSNDHKEKLRKFKITYEELKLMVVTNSIKSKREYQIWVKKNNIDAPLNPSSKSFYDKWEGWVSFLNKK